MKAKWRGAKKSLTVWVNSAVGLVLAGVPYLAEAIPQMKPFLDANTYQAVAGALVAANLLIRWFRTRKALEDK